MFAGLVLAGILAQGCSDNNGRVTSTSAPTTGFANTAADIVVQVGVNPNTITPGQRAGVTAFVTNKNGQPLAGKKVQFSTDVGSLDVTVGTTNASGQFSTFLRITATDVANAGAGANGFATVTAFVEGAVGLGVVNFGGNPVPAALTLIPPAVLLNEGATGATPGTCTTGPFAAAGSFSAQFTVTGGVPPYTFAVTGSVPGATVSSTGKYTAPVLGARAGGFATNDTVSVVDSAGNTASGNVLISCTAT